MLDEARLIQDGWLNYQYLDDWCRAKGGFLTGVREGGWLRISFPDAAGKKPGFFWLTRLCRRGAGRPLRAVWQQDSFAGPEAYFPGMLSVLLTSAARAENSVEILISLDNILPVGADPRAVHYFLLPTEFNLVLAHKGEHEVSVTLPWIDGARFGCQGEYESENLFIRSLEEVLAPAHPIYPVGPEATNLNRPVFLMGHRQAILKSLSRDEEGMILTFRLNTFPDDGPDEVAEYFKDALSGAGRPGAQFMVRTVHEGGRSAIALDDLAPLHDAYSRVLGLPPNIEWFTWPSPAGVLGKMGYKTAAFGPGRLTDYRDGTAFDRSGGEKLSLILDALMVSEQL